MKQQPLIEACVSTRRDNVVLVIPRHFGAATAPAAMTTYAALTNLFREHKVDDMAVVSGSGTEARVEVQCQDAASAIALITAIDAQRRLSFRIEAALFTLGVQVTA